MGGYSSISQLETQVGIRCTTYWYPAYVILCSSRSSWIQCCSFCHCCHLLLHYSYRKKKVARRRTWWIVNGKTIIMHVPLLPLAHLCCHVHSLSLWISWIRKRQYQLG